MWHKLSNVLFDGSNSEDTIYASNEVIYGYNTNTCIADNIIFSNFGTLSTSYIYNPGFCCVYASEDIYINNISISNIRGNYLF